jgi:glycosyltransferase involved in cell wall biosynthesis
VPGIVKLGHAVVINTWYGLQGEPQLWPLVDKKTKEVTGHVQVFPAVNGAAYGTDTMLQLYQKAEANCLITCQDVWVIPTNVTQHTNFCPWLPIDHDPPPPAVLEALKTAKYPMVYSKWGVEVLAKCGIESHYVPCSCDADEYKPIDRAEALKTLGVPEHCDFMISMVAANKDPDDRKGLANGMMGFAKFAKTHPNALLYMHTNWSGPVDIGALVKQLGLEKRVIQPDMLGYMLGTMKDEYMRWVYNASDVLLNPAKSEGFGLPILEAQMCGCPVIATDYSTTDELLFAGWKVKTHPNWTIGANTFRVIADIDSIADCLADAYDERGNEILRRQARDISMHYDTERVCERYWKPALREIEELVEGGSRGKLRMVTF